MNGAEALIKTAVDCGIEICFANPGTTELPIVRALDRIAGIKAVLGLFEGVCTGAADGFGRMAGKPAMTLLHLGPGLANGIANLHNARRAHTPLVNIVGEHATWHRPMDPPLAMDIEGLAKTVSMWVRTNTSAQELPRDVAEAVNAASSGGIASLIVPHDYQLAECKTQAPAFSGSAFDPIDPKEIEAAARLLRTRKKTALLLGGRAVRKQGLAVAARIRGMIGCDLLIETFPPVLEQGIGLATVKRIPYFPKGAQTLLADYDGVVLAGARDPVTFFGYPGVRSRILTADQQERAIGTGRQDIWEALAALADSLKGQGTGALAADARYSRPSVPEGALTTAAACQTLAALQPEGAIIVDEGLTTSGRYYSMSPGLPPHTILPLTGGAIGYGMPCALGAALACPDRPVINFQADGSAMYTVQALWSQAREGLNITTLICSNRSYRTLLAELRTAGVEKPGKNAQILTALTNPAIDWVSVSQGLGVPAISVSDVSSLADALKRSLAEPGPSLIEMVLAF
ncbi:MAG: acetolactate synthase large subunit [Desulfobacterales bacterium]|nr:acetolactate synthase large subunit [Desulfobacterales bacterium]